MTIHRTARLLATTGFLLSACQAGVAPGAGDGQAVESQPDALSTETPKPSTNMKVIAPVNGTTVPSPVWVRGHVTECNGLPPTSFGFSLDEESAITPGVTHYDIDTTVEIPSGAHTIHYKAWTSAGLCPVEESSFTVNGTTDGITVDSPANDASVTGSVLIKATGATCGGATTTALGYSVDEESAITWGSATALDTTDSTLTPGSHTIRFKAWAGSILCPVINRTVVVAAAPPPAGYDGSASIPNPPASATLFANIDDLSSWSPSTGAASACPNGVAGNGCNPPNANFDTTVLHVADPGTEPAGSDDTAGLFELFDGPANATCIWGHSIGTSTAARNFIWDFYADVTATGYANSELDFYQILDGQRFMMGTQCNRPDSSWDTWNESTQHWIHNTSINCDDVLTPNTWHHVVMYLSTDSTANTYTYHVIRIDGVDYPLEQTEPSHPSSWPNGLIGVQVQLDANGSGGGVNEYIEAMKAYGW
jgi:hypothetical protein